MNILTRYRVSIATVAFLILLLLYVFFVLYFSWNLKEGKLASKSHAGIFFYTSIVLVIGILLFISTWGYLIVFGDDNHNRDEYEDEEKHITKQDEIPRLIKRRPKMLKEHIKRQTVNAPLTLNEKKELTDELEYVSDL